MDAIPRKLQFKVNLCHKLSQAKFNQVMETLWAQYSHLQDGEHNDLWNVCCKDLRKGLNVIK